MYARNSGRLYMSSILFRSNVASSTGSALWWDASGDSLLTNCTFDDHVPSSVPMLQINKPLRWHCPLGRWMPLTGAFSAGNWSGCERECAPGTIGDSPSITSALGCASCPLGHFCPSAGLSAGIPCRTGTRMPAVGARTAESCLPCGAGRYNNLTGQTECTPCPAGSFTEDDNADACTPCPSGGWCPIAGASSRMVFQPCPSGSYNPSEGATSNASCRACPLGKASSVPGSSAASNCKPCPAGAFAATRGQSFCDPCPDGEFQSETEQSACTPCTMCTQNTTYVAAPCSAITDTICPLCTNLNCSAGQHRLGTCEGSNNGYTCANCPDDKFCPGDGNY